MEKQNCNFCSTIKWTALIAFAVFAIVALTSLISVGLIILHPELNDTRRYAPLLAGSLTGGAITGVAGALVAFWVAHTEDKRAQRLQSEVTKARKEEERNRLLNEEVRRACSRLQGELSGGSDGLDQAKAFRYAASKVTSLMVLLEMKERQDLREWLASTWTEFREDFTRNHVAVPGPQGEHFTPITDRKTLVDLRNRLSRIEYVCADWATKPVSEWSPEGIPKDLRKLWEIHSSQEPPQPPSGFGCTR